MNKKAQEDSTLTWVIAIFVILFILMVYFFIAFSMSLNKSYFWNADVKENIIAYSQDRASSEIFSSILNSEIEFNGKKDKILNAIILSFDSYFEVKNSEGKNLVEKYGLNNYNDISRTSNSVKIADGFSAEDLNKIDKQNQELASGMKKILDNYCSKYRVAIPQGMLTEQGKLETSDSLGNRIYFVMGWGDPFNKDWTPEVGLNITENGYMSDIKFVQLAKCSKSITSEGLVKNDE